jgi:NOL1/NOP2/fmu family ribosome biogenesis protein
MDWDILASKDIRGVHKMLEEQFGFSGKLEYGFLKNHEGNLYIVSRDIANIDWKKLRVTSMGSYFGELKKGLRLSIEGSQLVGPHATKNVIDISKEEMLLWLKGNDLPTTHKTPGLVIVKHDKDYMGCGSVKEGMILNFVPKIRRLPAQA